MTTVRIAEEAEYIRLTNLAKVRIAETVVRDIHPFGPITEKDWMVIRAQFIRWREALEAQGSGGEDGDEETYEVEPEKRS